MLPVFPSSLLRGGKTAHQQHTKLFSLLGVSGFKIGVIDRISFFSSVYLGGKTLDFEPKYSLLGKDLKAESFFISILGTKMANEANN